MAETPQKSYCSYVANLPPENVHRIYHDTEYGYPIHSDDALFGRLILEINQAGLSWNTILNKKENFRKAYDNYSIATIAAYGEKDRERLLGDAGIIRNKLKVDAAIYNAKQIQLLQHEYGSFKAWLDAQGVMDLRAWVKLFKQHLKFTGGEITNEFLMSTGYLEGAHVPGCPIYDVLNK